MSGLVRTSPIPEIIKKIELAGGIVLDPETARVDQTAGTTLAFAEGYRKIAVTVARVRMMHKYG